MRRVKASVWAVLLAGVLTLDSGALRLAAQTEQIVIKVATVAPRTGEIGRRAKIYNARLNEETQGRVQFRTYYGGVSGDDQTVMRKLRTGQIDAAPVGIDILSNYIRQATVMIAPQTFFNYKQVDAVRKELAPEFNKEAYDNGIKVISWWDAGRVRIFSKEPVRTFQDMRRARPWLYPASTLLKAFYKMISVTGVPLEVAEVYGGLQTNMIDVVWASPLIASILRWSSHIGYMSAQPVNVIQGAFILRRPTWEALRPEDQKAIEKISAEQLATTQKELRTDDDKTFRKLLTRGIVGVEFEKPEDWRKAGRDLRQQMIGRIYTKEMLARVEAITVKYND